jgi:hypothetical protein
MQRHPEITKRRLQHFARHIREKLYPHRAPVTLARFAAPGRISYSEALRGKCRPAQVGVTMGPPWSTHWFRVGIAIPGAWRGRPVHLLWDSCSEACVWEDGVDAVKKAEDSNAIVVRLYEAFGAHATVRLSSTLPFRAATKCNLLEEGDQPVRRTRGGVTLKLRPFEIVTIKLRR